MVRITVVLFAALTCLPAQVMAEGITGEAGLGLSYQPHDPTGSRNETRPVPYLDLDWGDVSLSTDDGLTWSAFKANGFSAGPFLNYLPGRTANGDLQGLHNVPDMGGVGVIGSSNLTAHFADAQQNQAFFGVSAHASRNSGIARYNASGGLQNVALTQSFEFPLTPHWSLVTRASWIHLTGSAADSSIVKQVGNPDQGEVQAAVAYKFK